MAMLSPQVCPSILSNWNEPQDIVFDFLLGHLKGDHRGIALLLSFDGPVE